MDVDVFDDVESLDSLIKLLKAMKSDSPEKGTWDIHIVSNGIEVEFEGNIIDKFYILINLFEALHMNAFEVSLLSDFYAKKHREDKENG